MVKNPNMNDEYKRKTHEDPASTHEGTGLPVRGERMTFISGKKHKAKSDAVKKKKDTYNCTNCGKEQSNRGGYHVRKKSDKGMCESCLANP